MVDKFNTILQRIINEKGDVTLFAALKMDEFTDKWTIVFCAPWSNELTRTSDFGYIANILKEELAEEERTLIARIGIFDKTEHLVELLLQLKTGTNITEDTRLNGNIIHQGFILASNNS